MLKHKATFAALFTIQLAIAASLFALDVFLGPGIADGVGYSIVIVLCFRNPKPLYSLAWAGFATVLIIAGGIITPDSSFFHAASLNRALEICTVWAVWFLIRATRP
jgi:hypothetical protein